MPTLSDTIIARRGSCRATVQSSHAATRALTPAISHASIDYQTILSTLSLQRYNQISQAWPPGSRRTWSDLLYDVLWVA